jgi:hypothetical protein
MTLVVELRDTHLKSHRKLFNTNYLLYRTDYVPVKKGVTTLEAEKGTPVTNIDQTTYLPTYEGVSISFQTGRLERELQTVQLSATKCSCIAIL